MKPIEIFFHFTIYKNQKYISYLWRPNLVTHFSTFPLNYGGIHKWYMDILNMKRSHKKSQIGNLYV